MQQLELDFTAGPAATPEERATRRQEARCAQCGCDLTANAAWFVWGPLGDCWCRSCSAAAGADMEGYE